MKSKKDISGDAQITHDAQNQLNLLLDLPLISYFSAYQAPKLTPEKVGEYKKERILLVNQINSGPQFFHSTR